MNNIRKLSWVILVAFFQSNGWASVSNTENITTEAQFTKIDTSLSVVLSKVKNSFQPEGLEYHNYYWEYRIAELLNQLNFLINMTDYKSPLMQFFDAVIKDYVKVLSHESNRKYQGYVSSGDSLLARIAVKRRELTKELDTLRQNNQRLIADQKLLLAVLDRNLKEDAEMSSLTRKTLLLTGSLQNSFIDTLRRENLPSTSIIVHAPNRPISYVFRDYHQIENNLKKLLFDVQKLNNEMRLLYEFMN